VQVYVVIEDVKFLIFEIGPYVHQYILILRYQNYVCYNYVFAEVCLFSWPYNPFGCFFHSPVAGFSLLICEVSRSHTMTRHSW